MSFCCTPDSIAVPSFRDNNQADGDWQKLAWWIHDHLPYSSMYFFPEYWAFNLSWHEVSAKQISSYPKPTGTLTRPGMANHEGSHAELWKGIR